VVAFGYFDTNRPKLVNGKSGLYTPGKI